MRDNTCWIKCLLLLSHHTKYVFFALILASLQTLLKSLIKSWIREFVISYQLNCSQTNLVTDLPMVCKFKFVCCGHITNHYSETSCHQRVNTVQNYAILYNIRKLLMISDNNLTFLRILLQLRKEKAEQHWTIFDNIVCYCTTFEKIRQNLKITKKM